MGNDSKLIFYRGKYVDLKVLDESDIYDSEWVGWFNDQDLCKYNLHHYFPNNYQNEIGILKSLDKNNKHIQLGVINKSNPESICGVVSLNSIDYIHRNANISGMIGDKKAQRNPLVLIESYSFLIKHAFNQLGLNKITDATLHPNVYLALKKYFNFEKEGVYKKHVFKDGEFRDLTIIALFANSVIYPEI